MLKFKGYTVTAQEVPEELSIVVNISGCTHHCPGCHSEYLWDNDGAQPLFDNLPTILSKYKDLTTCFCFMGGDWDQEDLLKCIKYVKEIAPKLKLCLYSGYDSCADIWKVLPYLNYVKIGHYDESQGGLSSRTTNQRMYKVSPEDLKVDDITYYFWRKPNEN